MIVKTAMNSDTPLSNARFLKMDEKFSYFICVCKAEFRIMNSKTFTDDYIKCSTCKRNSKVLPYKYERAVFRIIKYSALARGYEFDIDIEWFAKACHEPCVYCGAVDSNRPSVHGRGGNYPDWFGYNGVDRVDNNKGYTEINCVPACWTCNRAKWNMSHEDFMEWRDGMVEWATSTGGGLKV